MKGGKGIKKILEKSKKVYVETLITRPQSKEQIAHAQLMKKTLREMYPEDYIRGSASSEEAIRIFGDEIVKKTMSDKRFKQNIMRTKKTFEEILMCNLPRGPAWFITLTYGDKDQYDRKQAIRDFEYFRNKLPFKLSYLAVLEKHVKGDYHMHVVGFDIPNIKYNVIREAWIHAKFVKIKPITIPNHKKIANYMTKYLTKTEMVQNKKAYLVSRDTDRLKEFTDLKLASKLKTSGRLVSETEMNTKYHGRIYKYVYSLND